jgi:hypothetical protein
MNGSSENKHISSSRSLFPQSTHVGAPAAVCLPSGSLPRMKTYRMLLASNGFEARAVSIVVLEGRHSVGVVAAAGTTTATVTTTVASTSGRVATRGTTIAAAHGRSTVASIGATTTARAAATTASAAVHAGEVRSLGDDLYV